MSNAENKTEEKVKNIINSVELLPLTVKIDLALLNYSALVDEDKATVLNLWYQYKHDNIYFDNLSIAFNDFTPKIFMPPLNQERDKNYAFIYKSIIKTKGYLGIEETFLERIKSTQEEFEIDRLLYIIFAVSETYNIASNDLLMLSHKNWKRWGGKPFHYDLILIKTRIDVLQHRGEHRLAIDEASRIFKVIDSEKYKARLHWLKYQFANSLLNFYENGYSIREFSEKNLLAKRDRYEEYAIVDDHFNNI